MDLYEKLCQKETLYEAWKKVRKKNAGGGIDGVNPEDLDSRIDKIILELSQQLSENRYTPTSYQRINVPKFNRAQEWRGLSLPIVMDKIVQQAFVNLLSPLFEKNFLDCSYAYRPKKGPVRAIKRIDHILRTHKPKWTIALDIDDFFDTLNHDHLFEALAEKIDDKRFISLVRVWVKAGYISQKGSYSDPAEGIAQGAVISPLLSNMYLHALDVYAVERKIPYVRYSDNFIAFFHEKDQAYTYNEEISAFLKEDLLLELNHNPYPFRHVKEGFTFLGIYFKDEDRLISREKETKTYKKLNWLTNPSAYNTPSSALERINKSIQSKKRFYGFISPERQFAAFDAYMIKRLKPLLVSFGKKGVMKSKNELIEFINKVEFFIKRDTSEKLSLARHMSEDIFQQLKSKHELAEEAAVKEKASEAAQTKRSQAKKNRYLKKITDEAEVVITTPGIFIGKTSKRLVLREARKNIHESPFSKIRQVTVASRGVSLSSDVIWACAINKVPNSISSIDREGPMLFYKALFMQWGNYLSCKFEPMVRKRPLWLQKRS
jgi:group II intron reverse transcriptase/maturase